MNKHWMVYAVPKQLDNGRGKPFYGDIIHIDFNSKVAATLEAERYAAKHFGQACAVLEINEVIVADVPKVSVRQLVDGDNEVPQMAPVMQIQDEAVAIIPEAWNAIPLELPAAVRHRPAGLFDEEEDN